MLPALSCYVLHVWEGYFKITHALLLRIIDEAIKTYNNTSHYIQWTHKWLTVSSSYESSQSIMCRVPHNELPAAANHLLVTKNSVMERSIYV